MGDILAFLNENYEQFVEYLIAQGCQENIAHERAEKQIKKLRDAINF